MKKIVSLILAFVVLLSMSVFSFSATSNEELNFEVSDELLEAVKVEEVSLTKLAFWLTFDCDDYGYTFRFTDKIFDSRIECDKDSAEELLQLMDEVYDFYEEVYDGRKTTVEEIDSYYTKLDEAAKKIIIVPQELKYLIDCCKLENNDDSYYPAELWADFQSKIAVAEEVYSKGETTIEVSNAYWDLLFSFNDICIVNPLEGDVDFDGELSVIDATLVQRCVAKLGEFNSSQLTVLGSYNNKNIKILDATNIQRAVAKLDYDVISYSLPDLQGEARKRFLDSNNIFYYYRKQFMPYNGLDQDNIYQPNLP